MPSSTRGYPWPPRRSIGAVGRATREDLQQIYEAVDAYVEDYDEIPTRDALLLRVTDLAVQEAIKDLAVARPMWRTGFKDLLTMHCEREEGFKFSLVQNQAKNIYFGKGIEVGKGREKRLLKGKADALEFLAEAIAELRAKGNFVHILSVASERTGCAVILIHHTGKDPDKGGRGTSAIKDECQSEFILTGDKGSPKTVRHTKDRALGATVDDITLRYEDTYLDEDDVEPIGLRVVLVGADAIDDQHEKRVVAFLQEQGGTFNGSRTQLGEALAMKKANEAKKSKPSCPDSTPRVDVTKQCRSSNRTEFRRISRRTRSL